jgi:transcriptional regulator with XRE-family HTH domain
MSEPLTLEELGVIPDEPQISEARLRVAELRSRYGLSDSDIAKATDASARQVARWREQTGTRRASRYDERIEQLFEIIDALEMVLHDDPKGVKDFLKGKNRYLNNARPLNLLGAGRYDEVREAITRRRAGQPVPKEKPARRKAVTPKPRGDQSNGHQRGNAARRHRVSA